MLKITKTLHPMVLWECACDHGSFPIDGSEAAAAAAHVPGWGGCTATIQFLPYNSYHTLYSIQFTQLICIWIHSHLLQFLQTWSLYPLIRWLVSYGWNCSHITPRVSWENYICLWLPFPVLQPPKTYLNMHHWLNLHRNITLLLINIQIYSLRLLLFIGIHI